MKMAASEFERLKKKVEAVRDDISRSEGRLESLKETLSKEYGVSSKSEAEAKIREMRAEADEAEVDFDQRMDSFKAKWGDRLE